MTDWALIGAVVIAAFLPNEIWRWAGVIISSQIDETSAILAWVRAVSTALVAGLVARLIAFPPGALAGVDLHWRVLAFVLGVIGYYASGKRMAIGIVAGALAILASQLLG